MPLRFARPSPPSGWPEDFHSQIHKSCPARTITPFPPRTAERQPSQGWKIYAEDGPPRNDQLKGFEREMEELSPARSWIAREGWTRAR